MTVVSAPAPALVTPAGRRDRSRPMRRWAWRLFKREWRQQVLVLALLIVAVAATLFGTGAATNVPHPAATMISLPGTDPSIPADLNAITAA
ncbi:MAG TPA: hypothetical protein VFH70_10360, partial [Acidimicrobiales bacterium]|nr:hypothetical protein [Acidimicrobiales bacterium]